MSYRTLTAALATATVLFATQSYAQTNQPGGTKADKTTPPKGTSGPAEVINLNSSKSNVNRMGGGGGTKGSAGLAITDPGDPGPKGGKPKTK